MRDKETTREGGREGGRERARERENERERAREGEKERERRKERARERARERRESARLAREARTRDAEHLRTIEGSMTYFVRQRRRAIVRKNELGDLLRRHFAARAWGCMRVRVWDWAWVGVGRRTWE